MCILASDLLNRLLASRAKRKLALLRIHKTGSKSFRAALRRCYPASALAPEEYSTTVTSESLNGRSFISPHLSLAQWLALDGSQDWIVAVTLRDPRARLRSAFRYFKSKRGSKPLQVGELLADLDYRAFLESNNPVLVGLKDNVLTRFLGGGLFGSETETRNQLYLPKGVDLDVAEKLATAALKAGQVLPLVLERQQESLALVCNKIGVRRMPPMGWQNRTQGRPMDQPDSTTEAMEDALIAHDQRLYALAVSLLKKPR